MRAVVQRVSRANVEIDGLIVGEISHGLVALVGVHRDDEEKDAVRLADRLLGMRIFDDEDGRLNLALKQVDGAILAISNFTVYGDSSQRRPSFGMSASFDRGRTLFNQFLDELRKSGCTVATGEFGAQMNVQLINDGPVTVVVDTR